MRKFLQISGSWIRSLGRGDSERENKYIPEKMWKRKVERNHTQKGTQLVELQIITMYSKRKRWPNSSKCSEKMCSVSTIHSSRRWITSAKSPSRRKVSRWIRQVWRTRGARAVEVCLAIASHGAVRGSCTAQEREKERKNN